MDKNLREFFVLVVYVPVDACEQVKRAIFAQGAGKIGNYDSCSWQVTGSGQFRPLAGSSPVLGRHEVLERTQEVRLEVTCEKEQLAAVLEALLDEHPFEEPAYHFYSVQALARSAVN